jgi:TRAP-type mannitol/chloroaromatic compound transport system substrate-binding protein
MHDRYRAFAMALAIAVPLLQGCGGEPGTGEGGPAQERRTFTWTLVTTWPKNLPALGTAPERLADIVETMSDGRLKIRVYGAGELVPAFEVFDAVSSGTAEIGHGAAYYWRGKVPEAAFFTTVPFGLNAQEMNGWLHYGGGLELWQELYEPFGVIPMAGGNTGVQFAGWFNREVNSLEDLQGLRMRIPGLGGEVFERAGGVPVSMPGNEMLTSMQTGAIDAVEWVGPYNDRAFGLHQVAEFYYYPGWHEPGPTMETIVNAEAFRALPEDLQEILRVASRAINQDMLDEYTARNNAALRELKAQGVKVRKLPDDVLARLRELSAEVVAEVADDNPMARRIYDSYRAYREDVLEYSALTEEAYAKARRPEDD